MIIVNQHFVYLMQGYVIVSIGNGIVLLLNYPWLLPPCLTYVDCVIPRKWDDTNDILRHGLDTESNTPLRFDLKCATDL
jgi:hypothetical protein